MEFTRNALPCRFYFVVSLLVIGCNIPLTAADLDRECLNLCKQFVEHVAEIRKQKPSGEFSLPKSSLCGVTPSLTRGITFKAAEFCFDQLDHKETCNKLVKNTWNVLIAIEIGSKPDTICRLLETCQRNKTNVIVQQDTAKIYTKFTEKCGAIFDDPARLSAICLRIPAVTQQLVDLFSRVLKGGELATEAQKCSKSGKEIGCEVKNLSPENKVALALVYSMLPSFSELKERVKDKFLEPGRMCQLARASAWHDNQATEERLVSLKKECRSSCIFATRNFFSSFSSGNSNITEAFSSFQAVCTFVGVTQLDKCEKLYKFANDYKDEFSTTMAGQFCSSEDICQVPSQNELEMHRKKYCNETLTEDHNSFHGVRYSAKGGSLSERRKSFSDSLYLVYWHHHYHGSRDL